MTEAQLRPLRAKLYERNWTDDEIRERVMVHSPYAAEAPADEPPPMNPPDGAPEVDWHPAETLELDADDPVARATERAALELAELGRDPCARVVERTLANAPCG